MDGLPVTVRLLDPPLHEFLPHVEAGGEESKIVEDLSAELGVSVDDCLRAIDGMREVNPMLGLRVSPWNCAS
jgi:pyruvate,orthophosphate dikinase